MRSRPKHASDDSLPTRSSMLVRLRDAGDERTWSEFYGRYQPLVQGFALKLGLSREEAEEVSQDVFAEVSTKISDFDPDRGKGSFRRWLFQRAEWRVKDKFRVRSRNLPVLSPAAVDESATAPGERIAIPADLETVWEEEWAKHELEVALRQLARKVPAKKYQAFELHALREWPVHEVSRALGMNPATVCVNTHRLRKLLKQELARLRE